MEIEKKRETSWKIQLKDKKETVELTSVEISGEVRLIRVGLLNEAKSIKVEMTKSEFYNFLSLLIAFKDVIIGEESITIKEYEPINVSLTENKEKKITDNIIENNKKDAKLNPEEWDPW